MAILTREEQLLPKRNYRVIRISFSLKKKLLKLDIFHISSFGGIELYYWHGKKTGTETCVKDFNKQISKVDFFYLVGPKDHSETERWYTSSKWQNNTCPGAIFDIHLMNKHVR
jgi:hypothetical protein